MDKDAFIKEQILAGKDREAVRGMLISVGESTVDLESVYDALVAELGVETPKAPAPTIPEYTESIYARTEEVMPFPALHAVLGYGFSQTLLHWKEVLLCSLLLFIPVVLFAFVPLSYPPIAIGVLALSLFVSVVGLGILAYALCGGDASAHPSLSFQWAMSRFLPFLWLLLLITFVLLGTLITFVVPFFLFSLYIAFAVPVLVKENKGGVRALLRSHDLVKGNFLRIGGYVCAVTLLGLCGGLLSSVFLLLPVPYVGQFFALLTQVFFFGLYLSVIARLYTVQAQHNPLFELSAYTGFKWSYRFFAFIGVLALCACGWYALTQSSTLAQTMLYPHDEMWELFGEREGVEDTFNKGIVQSKVTTTDASARLFVGRMGFYDGVCNDISVVPPVQCTHTVNSFVIYAPLTPTSFYCRDSYGFAGEVTRIKDNACQ